MVLFIFSYEKNEHYLKKTAKNHLKCSSPDNCEPHTPRHISYHLSNYNNKTHTKISTQKAKKKFTRPSFTANPEALACRACFSYFFNSRCANAELHSFFVPRAFPRGPRTSANPPLEAPPRSIFSIVCTIFLFSVFSSALWRVLNGRSCLSAFRPHCSFSVYTLDHRTSRSLHEPLKFRSWIYWKFLDWILIVISGSMSYFDL